MLLLALMFDPAMFAIVDGVITSYQTTALTRFVWRCRTSDIRKFDIDDLLTAHGREMFRAVFNPDQFPGLEELLPSLQQQIRAYVVRPPVCSQLPAFQDLNGSCVMFFNDERKDLTPTLRFKLLHELGHATKGNAASLIRLSFMPRFAASALWIVTFSSGHRLYATGLLLLLLFIRSKLPLSPANTRKVALFQEMAADRFAAENSDMESIEEMLMKVSHRPVVDSRIPGYTKERTDFLLKLLKARNAGRMLPTSVDPLAMNVLSTVGNLLCIGFLAWYGSVVSWMAVGVAALVVCVEWWFYLKVMITMNQYQREAIVNCLDRSTLGGPKDWENDSLDDFIRRMNK